MNVTDFEQVLMDHQTLKENMNHYFLLSMGALVMLMQAGFAMIEAATVRSKNTTSILIKNISDMCFGAVAFWVCGYAFAFGKGSSIVGWEGFLTIGLPTRDLSFFFFQSTFATTCATIISGAIAERSEYNGYVIFSFTVIGFVYPVQAHWCWGPEGWLKNYGFSDFAGSGVVHLAGGTCALAACLVIGPRIGRYGDGRRQDIKSHSIPLLALGFFILVFGFLAFNGGSQASITSPGDGEVVAGVFVCTLLSCCAGGISALTALKVKSGYWKIGPTINGGLAGMISVCSGCDGFSPWAGVVAGTGGGIVYLLLAAAIPKIGIDDPIEAVAVHGGAGMWGLLIGPLLRADDGGVFYAGSFRMLLWNSVGILAIVAWNGIVCLLLFASLNKVGLLRVSVECEEIGLDFYKHDEESYPEFVTRPRHLVERPRHRNLTAAGNKGLVVIGPITNQNDQQDPVFLVKEANNRY